MKIKTNNVLVVGDSILDNDIKCETIGLSLETPTLKTKLLSENYTFGGASNVVTNLLALGVKVTYITPVASDRYAIKYEQWAHNNLRLIPVKYCGENVVKSRYWIHRGSNAYKYLQINQGTEFPEEKLELVTNILSEELRLNSYDAVIYVDYRNGLFKSGRPQTRKMIENSINNGVKTYAASQVSDKGSQYELLIGVDVICMNQDEAKSVVPTYAGTPADLKKISDKLNSRVCVTMGDKGSMIQTSCGPVREPSYKVEAVDTCGAGDCFLAALVASGEDLTFSNKWAAASIKKIGTNAPDLKEVLSWT